MFNPSSAMDCRMVSDGKKVSVFSCLVNSNPALTEMFKFTESLFEQYPDIKLEEHDNSKKITVHWKQQYDVEQLMEHAIVHILRHRRQIERFKIAIQNSGL